MKTKPIAEWLAEARRLILDNRLQPGQQDEPKGDAVPPPAVREAALEAGLEAQLLLSTVLEKPRAWLIAHAETEINAQQQMRLDRLLEQLLAGIPLPYLLGHWEFYGLAFAVSPAVLIPRPETELLVERAIAWLRDHPGPRAAADVGTGSGCIAISIASQCSQVQIIATDISWGALQVARQNARRHGVSQRMHLVQGNLLSAAAGTFDLVCANLPYIPRAALAELSVARHEPRLALDGGPDGLAPIQTLLADAHRWLAPGGLLLLEMQFDQGEAIQQIAQRFLINPRITIHPDLAGLPRLVEIEHINKN